MFLCFIVARLKWCRKHDCTVGRFSVQSYEFFVFPSLFQYLGGWYLPRNIGNYRKKGLDNQVFETLGCRIVAFLKNVKGVSRCLRREGGRKCLGDETRSFRLPNNLARVYTEVLHYYLQPSAMGLHPFSSCVLCLHSFSLYILAIF